MWVDIQRPIPRFNHHQYGWQSQRKSLRADACLALRIRGIARKRQRSITGGVKSAGNCPRDNRARRERLFNAGAGKLRRAVWPCGLAHYYSSTEGICVASLAARSCMIGRGRKPRRLGPALAHSLTRIPRRSSSHPLERRGHVLGGHAAEVAGVGGIVVGAAAVQRAAVVPDHHVADAPRMPVHELALCGVLHQVAQ